MINSILEHVILKNGVTTHISGEKVDADFTPSLVSIASKTAVTFCEAADIGDFEVASGFDSRGGFVIQHSDEGDELIRTDTCIGWNLKRNSHFLEHQDVVSKRFCNEFNDSNGSASYPLHMPLWNLLKIIQGMVGFQFLALRHKSGQWIDPIDRKSKSKHNKVCMTYYSLARILYSQDLPASRLFIKASNGHALSWRSHDKTCGLTLWKRHASTILTRHCEMVDGLALAFTH